MNELNERNAQQAQVAVGRTVQGNLEYKTASMLCYTPLVLINVIAPIIWLATEPGTNKMVRFHAIQGLALCAVSVVLSVINSVVIGALAFAIGAFALLHLTSSAIFLAFFGYSLYGMYCTYQGRQFRIPILCDIAEKNA